MKQAFFFFCMGVWTVSLSACGIPAETNLLSGSSHADTAFSNTPSNDNLDDTTAGTKPASATIYIGTNGQFEEYPVKYTGICEENGLIPVTELFSAMADLTGWNLDLAAPISSNQEGITVTFANTYTLFSVPSNEDSHKDILQRDQMLLDSVKRTLQCWAIDPEIGDPNTLDIWFHGPDGGDLVLKEINITIASTEPYRIFPAG